MYYSKLVKKAALISYEAHINDLDKGGYPYFMHPLTLALGFETEDEVIVSLLHDVIEDHKDKYDFNYLKDCGFNDNVINALKLLTKEDNLDYLEYINKIKENELAKNVKLADLKHNLDNRRIDNKIFKKTNLYKEAIKILES